MGATKSLLSYHRYIPDTTCSMDTGIKSSTEGPTDEASIRTEPNKSMSTTSTLKRKVCTKTCVTKLTAANILLPPPEEYIPARKKPRLSLRASLPAIAADTDTLNAYASPDAAGVAVASADTGTDPVAASPMQPNNVGAAQATHRRWTPEEDTKLTCAVNTTCKKKYGEDYTMAWVPVSALVPGRTKLQCLNRWHSALACKSDEATARKGEWTTDEDIKLKDAVEKHNGKNWEATAALVPGRTKQQCSARWHDNLAYKGDEMTTHGGKWTKEEDNTLKDAVEKHNGEDWAAISELLHGRTKQQCNKRWHGALDSKSDEMTAHKSRWTKEEDGKLKDAVKKHNGKNWEAIAALVPGRTKQQCLNRWHSALDSKTNETTSHKRKWTKEEDGKLKDAVEKHNGKNWASIAALVPGRTKNQCRSRWHKCLGLQERREDCTCE
jgi:hypothetical protein